MASGPPGKGKRQGERGEGRQNKAEGAGGPGARALTAGCQHSPGQCSTGDGVPGVFFAPQAHQATVDGGEQAPPHREATCRETEAESECPKIHSAGSGGFQGLTVLARDGEKNPDTKAESKLLGDTPCAPLCQAISDRHRHSPHLCRGLTSVYKQISLLCGFSQSNSDLSKHHTKLDF